jgi:6-phosphofructokinase 1
LEGKLIDLGRQKPEILEGLKQTPSAALGVGSDALTDEDCERALETCKKYRIRFLVYMGDRSAMAAAYQLSEFARNQDYPLNFMAIPHSAENDLGFTDHCFGYATAAKWNALTTRNIGRDLEAFGQAGDVKIIETMGRHAGWLAAATALARDTENSAPHLIYLPESPFDAERFLTDVESVYSRLGYCCAAVSEGTASKGGHRLCSLISKELKIQTSHIQLGELSRSTIHPASEVDFGEALMAGQAAVRRAVEGMNGFMITISRHIDPNKPYSSAIGMARLRLGANSHRPVPEQFINEAGNDVMEAFLNYARPLLGESLPAYIRLEDIPVEDEPYEPIP